VLYRGYILNLAGILPYAGIDLAVYESLKNYYMSLSTAGLDESTKELLKKEGAPAPTPVLLACGTVSCLCGQFFR